MYAHRFGLAAEPFSIAPDPRFLYMSERHREALAHLLYGLQGGGGFVLLTGEIGAGKTTVCRCFLEQLPAHCNLAYVFNPRLSDTELLQTVCDEFHLTLPATAGGSPSVKQYVDALNAFLLAAHAQGRQNVLVIDEAQNLSASLLEQLRLLTNLETAERKLLQIILIGQPELRSLLARPELEPLAQRVIARWHLGPLSADETEAYVRHRLGVAGCSGELPFDAAALRRIHGLSRGVPRRINLLCDRALLGAYASGQARVTRRIVEQAAREVFDEGGPPAAAAAPRWALAGGAALALLAGAGGFWLGGSGSPDGAATAAGPAALAAPTRDPLAAKAASAALVTAVAPVAPPASAAATPAPTATADPNLYGRAGRDEAGAWRALAALWPGSADAGPPCATGQALRCHKAALTLAQIRQLARPGLLLLYADSGGAPSPAAYALLLGLDEQQALLQLGEDTEAVPLPRLARWWRGEFATLWRAPEGLPDGVPDAAQPALAAWLGRQLSALPGADPQDERPLRQRIAAFQLAQGLKADGVPGPMTLMQLNRAAGVQEPRLRGTGS